jgi:hypothetical protein
MYSLQLSRHVSTKWLTVDSPYIPYVILPASYLGFVQFKSSQSQLTKRLGGWVHIHSVAGKF